jgi:hypothetical protein
VQCRNCGGPVEAARVELGYDYCLEPECQQRCVKRVQLAAVAVNKAADYYTRAEEVLPAHAPLTPTPASSDVDSDSDGPPPRRLSRTRVAPRPKSTLERLREQEVELDAALERSYQRFCRGEITAKELDRERDQLIRVFDERVMAENIRYRSMRRGRSGR